MVRAIRARWARAATLWLLAAFAVGFAGDLVHTDDGCQVEVHCLACQRVLVSVGVAGVAVQWHAPIEVVGFVAPAEEVPASATAAPATASRAPPLA